MNAPSLRHLLCLTLSLGPVVFPEAAEPPTIANVPGGLVVQLGAVELNTATRLSRTGRYIIHVLDVNAVAVKKARVTLKTGGVYGLAFAETLTNPAHLPYTENLVNVVVVHSLGNTPLTEVFRILAPRGTLLISPGAGLNATKLKAAGFV